MFGVCSAATGIPTATTGSCVKLGHIGNDVDNYAHMITTVGFYNGVTAGEHTQIDRLYGANTGCLLIPDSIVARKYRLGRWCTAHFNQRC